MTLDSVSNLWPTIQVDILSPTAIMRKQASLLTQNTQGILEGEVENRSDSDSNEFVRAAFVIVAPALERYRCELFTIFHVATEPYPVTVFAEGLFIELNRVGKSSLIQPVAPDHETDFEDQVEVVASSQDEFVEVLRLILRARRTQGIVQSLIARTNEIRLPADATKN